MDGSASMNQQASHQLYDLFSALRRWPDIEAENLFAVDAADRLVFDILSQHHTEQQATGTHDATPPLTQSLAVVGDHYGALSLGALALGAPKVRVYTDGLTARRAIEANLLSCAEFLPADAATRIEFVALDRVAEGCSTCLMVLPRGLNVLTEQAAALAAAGPENMTVFATGRIKHMNHTMNHVLSRFFSQVQVSLARQKSRVLIASFPTRQVELPDYPVRETHQVAGMTMTLVAGAQTFGEARLDPGTRVLLEHLPALDDHDRLIDLACGNGSIGIFAALRNPQLRIVASDHSASAVASTLLGAQANAVAERINAVQDDGLSRLADASARLITLNPPFHVGNTVSAQIAFKLIDEAARVLEDGGQLYCVFNSHLKYRSELARRVGPTEQLARNAKFTVTRSTRRRF